MSSKQKMTMPEFTYLFLMVGLKHAQLDHGPGFTKKLFITDLEYYLGGPVDEDFIEEAWTEIVDGCEKWSYYGDDTGSVDFVTVKELSEKHHFEWSTHRAMQTLLAARKLAITPNNEVPLIVKDEDTYLRLRGGAITFILLWIIQGIHEVDYRSKYGRADKLDFNRYFPDWMPQPDEKVVKVKEV